MPSYSELEIKFFLLSHSCDKIYKHFEATNHWETMKDVNIEFITVQLSSHLILKLEIAFKSNVFKLLYYA